MTVAEILMEVLTSAGVRYLFGNPGTTELPFLDALPDSGLEYVVGLQEAVAVAAADGYAQASGQVGVVNVHVAPGVANSLSILHNAARARAVGDRSRRRAAPCRRRAPCHRRRRRGPCPGAPRAGRPGRAPGRPRPRRARVSPHQLPQRSPAVAGRALPGAERRQEGAGGLRCAPRRRSERLHVVPPRAGRAFPARAAGRPDRRRSMGDRAQLPRDAGHRRRPQGHAGRADGGARRADERGRPRRRGRAGAADRRGTSGGGGPDAGGGGGGGRPRPHLAGLPDAHAGLRRPRRCGGRGRVGDVIALRPALPAGGRPGSFFGSKTGTLGWGMGAAVGVQLGAPGRKGIATIGDGSVMYAPQALWTAAHYRLPITYVVPNNASYAILKSGMLSLGLQSAKRG